MGQDIKIPVSELNDILVKEGEKFLSITPETIFILVLIFAPFVLFLLWFACGRDRPIIETVEFRPPEGMSPAEVGLLWGGRIHDRDISAVFLDWANKGVISIETFDEGDLLIRNKGTLSENAKPFEERLYRRLFIRSDTVPASMLKTEIQYVKDSAKSELLKLYGRESIKSLFDLRSIEMRNLAYVISLLPFIFYSIYLYELKGPGIFEGALSIYNMGSLGILMVIVGARMVLAAREYILDRVAGKPFTLTMAKTIFLSPVVVISVIVFGIIGAPFLAAPLHACLTAASTILCILLAIIMPKRTVFYTQVLGRIRGYANFVRAAELDRIKMLIDENPNYSSDVLPYIWAMGMLNEWSELLDRYSLVAAPPDWFKGHSKEVKFSYKRMTDLLSNGLGYDENSDKRKRR